MEKQILSNYKKDAIKRFWCQLISVQDFDKLRIDDNGWSDWNCRKLITSNLWDTLNSRLKPGRSNIVSGMDLLYRPTSLNGIENNNGWNRIYSVADLPKIGNTYLFLANGREITQWCEFGMSFPKSHTHWRNVPEILKPLY
jgi:hypothetical protein